MNDSSSSDSPQPPITKNPSSRRNFLQAGMAGVAGGVAATMASRSGMRFVDPESVMAQSTLTPDAALDALMDGNRRFVSGNTTAHEHDIEILKRHLVDKQQPFAAVLSCADSRVPVELIFDQTIGQFFVTRVAGNMASPEIIASLEFGVAVLGLKVIMVLGHSDCGAVKAAIANKTVPGVIGALYPYLRAAIDTSGPDVKGVTESNAKIQAHILSESSTVIAAALKEKTLKVVAGYYDIGTGSVSVLG